MSEDLLKQTPKGLYCPAGDFYVDPIKRVKRAVITHAHMDHARQGSENYLCSSTSEKLLKIRLGKKTYIQSLNYGKKSKIGNAQVSFHPAGHILGSAQVRIEVGGEVWVVSGDYNPAKDITCEPFEPVNCHCFITECTFGLPVYRWRPQVELMKEINEWWKRNAEMGKPSVMLAYSLGKAQRVIAGLDPGIGPIMAHEAVIPYLPAHREYGVVLPEVKTCRNEIPKEQFRKAIVIIPPAADESKWHKALRKGRTAMVSGWMTTRGAKKQSKVESGFALSDHADWNGILMAIQSTGANKILATHGNTDALVRYLNGMGYESGRLGQKSE
ncbi:MAG: ligase-associated DNA damage response exonuclease [Opitutae bacterium]|nr:ligase-associated DNA damage response exonuclease [Opitutae bacterium]